MTITNTPRRIWLVTGASSGIGLAVVEYVLSQGDIVVATLRKPSAISHLEQKYNRDKLLVLKLDVTKVEEIAAVFAHAVKVFGRIDVVFNNAGTAQFAEVESTPVDIARNIMETNFWGATNVAREAIHVFRDVQPRTEQPTYLISTSSLAALTPSVLGGYYGATKFALNGLLEALAQEIDPAWKIKITSLELGMFDTGGLNEGFASLGWIPAHPAYTQNPSLPSAQGRAFFAPGGSRPAGVNIAGEPRKAAAMIYKVSTLKEPPLHFLLGKDAIETAKTKGRVLLDAADQWESWSEDLLWDN